MIKIRDANIIDSNQLLNWRNDPETKDNSKNKKTITNKLHNSWLRKFLKNKNNFFFIFENKKENIGSVRYEYKKKENKYYVSINLNPLYRNKGYGKRILILGDQKINKLLKDNIILVAEVAYNNQKSKKTFTHAGYKIVEKKNKYIIYNKLIEKKMVNKSKKETEFYLKIIDEIQQIRSKNNTNWMDLLRIAFKHDPKKAGKVMSKIYEDDKKISKLAKKLSVK